MGLSVNMRGVIFYEVWDKDSSELHLMFDKKRAHKAPIFEVKASLHYILTLSTKK